LQGQSGVEFSLPVDFGDGSELNNKQESHLSEEEQVSHFFKQSLQTPFSIN